jgi:hypothetical protein
MNWRTIGDMIGAHGPAVNVAQSYAPSDYSIHFFLQIAVILLVCRVVGWMANRFMGQPQVVGEMIAGVVLGPSLFGLFFPEFQAALFPKETRNMLYVGAQFGVGLYMFLVGTTLRLDHFQSKAKSAVGVSAAGIIAPFLFAAAITPFLLDIPGLFTEGLGQGAATLFMGACIALTAFPMLARIINERGSGEYLARHAHADRRGIRRRRILVRAGDRARNLWRRARALRCSRSSAASVSRSSCSSSAASC